MKGGHLNLIPQTHVIIAKEIHQDVEKNLNIKLDKTQLIFGSVKPDIYSGLPKLKHFKPQSFDAICREIQKVSSVSLSDNRAHLAYISQKIGIITHYVADYFCVPHNDRKTYQDHFWDHLKYEGALHKSFKNTISDRDHKVNLVQGIDFTKLNQVKRYLDALHQRYESQGENMENDIDSSLFAVKAVASMIVQHATSQVVVCPAVA